MLNIHIYIYVRGAHRINHRKFYVSLHNKEPEGAEASSSFLIKRHRHD